jgi:hypothetical protein
MEESRENMTKEEIGHFLEEILSKLRLHSLTQEALFEFLRYASGHNSNCLK